MIKKALLFTAVFAFFVQCVVAQGPKPVPTNELGIMLGASYYLGDLNPNGHFRFLRPAGGLFYRHSFGPRFAYRVNLWAGGLYANDNKGRIESQKERNLHFRSLVAELSLQGEFNFMEYEVGNPKYPFSPYLFAGIGAFYFNPKAEMNDSWEKLRPLHTEGQGTASRPGFRQYSIVQPSIPFGMGIKANLSERMGFTLEWGLRKTFTDYIDDVSTTYPYFPELTPEAAAFSDRTLYYDLADPLQNVDRQRGNKRTKDWYSFINVSISFKLGREGACPSYH